ncbi:uncharacterized protein LOC127082144 [Lathyrus oleraceus]|uniref:uncharacterized protein LOC127082144 n=1 Tax=Pisum sativum TaxID=3888 RepID=UPI0021CEF393|nr:uncharacterized protein LOC127082144 [Pisum sativum]
MVNRNQNVDNVIRKIQHDDMATYNNLEAMVKRIMVRNGVNLDLRRPNYTSPLSEYILQAETPPRTKIPKFTKFSGDTTESTVENVAKYLIEAGYISNNENFRIKFFPSSLTKNAFTWFTTLPQSSIHTWNQLERMFHEQFYMGQTKISLKELTSIKRKFIGPIDDYLNRLRLLKARRFMQVPEYELVEMVTGSPDYFIRKKLDIQYLRDTAQLVDKVRQLECLKEEKARANKNKRVAYVDFSNDGEGSYNGPSHFDENEIDLAELKQRPSYACKVLAPSNGKNPIEPEKNDKLPKKTYTFDVTKCDEIFNLDLVQNSIQEGRLKFGDKSRSQMKIDSDPLQVADAHYTELEEVNLVEVTNDFDMTEVTEDFINEPIMVRISEHLDHEFFNDFIQEAMGDSTNKSANVFDAGITEDSNLMIVTKETADGFVQIDKATDGLQL